LNSSSSAQTVEEGGDDHSLENSGAEKKSSSHQFSFVHVEEGILATVTGNSLKEQKMYV
jgi:hypothetical protein